MHLSENKMKNNFVAKNDYNRSSVHKDEKNDYDRSEAREQIEEEMNSLFENASAICLEEYGRTGLCGN